MRFHIFHRTRYRYACPVSLRPHRLLLRPRCDGSQHLTDFRVRVQPRPRGWSESVDLQGNAVSYVWFDGLTESLTVVSTGTVETLRKNPFDFLVEPWATALPLRPDGELSAQLAPYQLRPDGDESVTRFASAVAMEVANETVPFLSRLSRRIAQSCRPQIRPDGDPQLPAVTLREGTGACRDLAVLFIDACRAMGLAARFVSGYFAGPVTADGRYLHAWAEVFLPGAGWRGFDPLQGLAATNQHIPVAVSAQPAGAAPISGTFEGPALSSRMEVDLVIKPGDEPAR